MKNVCAVLAFVCGASIAAAQSAVITRNTNLRTGPARTRAIKEKLHPRDEVTILDAAKTNGYYDVRVADGADGWVWARSVRITAVTPDTTNTGNTGGTGGTGGPPAIFHGCGLDGLTSDAHRQESNRKKNRTTRPQAADIDANATLTAIEQPGDDRTRWSDTRGASIVGYVVEVKKGSKETVNCGDTAIAYIDTHIVVVENPANAGGSARMIVEVIPRWRAFVALQGADWTTNTLKQTLQGHWVRVTGWLFWDFEHVNASEHTNPGGSNNWRATAWEIHPITEIKICPGTPQTCD